MLGDLLLQLRPRHCAIATVLVQAGDVSAAIDPGSDPVSERSLFEIGSITKTVTGTLLAVLVEQGLVSLQTAVGDVLDVSGPAAPIVLQDLATHTSGLPRLAPNHDDARVDSQDPYRFFDADALREALLAVELGSTAPPEYSNLGFQLLGHVLERAAGRPYGELVIDEVLRPVGCERPRCGDAEAGDDRIAGYDGTAETPRWHQPLAGAGGIELDITDFGRWIAANAFPESTPLADAITLAQTAHWGDGREGRGLGWRHYNGGLISNGGTGGFRAFCGFVPGMAGVGVLTNLGGWDAIDSAAIRFLTKVVTRR